MIGLLDLLDFIFRSFFTFVGIMILIWTIGTIFIIIPFSVIETYIKSKYSTNVKIDKTNEENELEETDEDTEGNYEKGSW